MHHEQLLEFEEPKDGSPPSITLSIERGSQDDKWEITPVTPNRVRNFSPCLPILTVIVLTACMVQQIAKRKVDRMRRKSNLPYCRMKFKWTGESRHTFPCVSRRVELEGAKHPEHYFSIHLPDRGIVRPQSVDQLKTQITFPSYMRS